MMPNVNVENGDQPRDQMPANPGVVELLLRAVRLYTYNTPIAKGKYRFYIAALKLLPRRPSALLMTLKDGRRFVVDLNVPGRELVFFLGEYEAAVTEIAAKLIRKDGICLDVGANFGWYTTLLSLKAGRDGQVHSFEPVPKSFEELSRNRELLRDKESVFINNLALGDREDTVQINLFEGLSSGHASLATRDGISGLSIECPMTTLDGYLARNNVGDVDFVKVDIEGAEMMFFRGAESLFRQAVPPIFLVEMALAQTRSFGYLPNDLIEFIGTHARYDFYKVDEAKGTLVPIQGFEADDIGANVFCIPKDASEGAKAVVRKYLDV